MVQPEINFRVWDYRQKKFEYGSFELFSKYSFPLNWCSITLRTGLLTEDCNDIYHHDILQLDDDDDETIVWVDYNDILGCWCLMKPVSEDDSILFAHTEELDSLVTYATIIGNTYENSELLNIKYE